MSYKEKMLSSCDVASALNEVRFEIATARAEGVELLIIKYCEDEAMLRFVSKVSFLLRRMKQRRKIQLYASPDNFVRLGTESVYLKNKYPDVFKDCVPTEEDRVIYIKL